MSDYLFRIGVSATTSDVFVVQDCPVKITVWGMAPTDVIEFEEVQRTDTSQLSANSTCCIVSTGGVTVTDTLPYLVDCTCVPQGSLTTPRIWIDQPGYYRAVLKDSGGGAPTGVGLANVQVIKDCMSEVRSNMRGCCQQYCPSQPLLDGGFGYHNADPKDPAATVEIAPCAGDTSVDSIWVYPTASPGNTALVTDCDGNVIGYGANQSTCAVTCPCSDLAMCS